MINIDREHGLTMKGKLSEIEAETIIILSELYKKLVEFHGANMAEVIMVNMVTKGIVSDAKYMDIESLRELENLK
jgi:hypothetical protein